MMKSLKTYKKIISHLKNKIHGIYIFLECILDLITGLSLLNP
jgi:hypothetical protein